MRTLGQALPPVLVLIWLCMTAVAQTSAGPKRVLLLLPSESHFWAQTVMEDSLRSTLENGSAAPILFFSDYLDAARTKASDYEKELVALLRLKYHGIKIDLIVTFDDYPLSLLLRHRAELVGDTPIVFVNYSRPNIASLNPGPNVTGVWTQIDLGPSLEVALKLQPGTKQVVVVSAGVTDYDKSFVVRTREDFRRYEGRVEFNYLTGLTIAELQQALPQLPQHTVVLFMSAKAGKYGDIRTLAPRSSAPIYGLLDSQLGFGIVGGSLLSFEALGADGAQIGLRILAGEKPQDIPPHGIPNVMMFDWRELKRWGISEKSLPAGSIVRFRVPSFWDLYSGYIVSGILVFLIQLVLIVGLVVNRSRLRRAEVEREHFASLADAERRRLNELILNVPGIVWESLRQPEEDGRRVGFVSQYVEKMLGYSVGDWTPEFAQSIIYEEDREEVKRATAAVIKSGKDGVFQFRWFAKDGRQLWAETNLTVTRDETGKTLGVRGVTTDITHRKLAEESLRQSEERNSAILRAIPDLMFLQTSDGVYLDYHANDQRDLLLPPAEFLGKNMRDVLPPKLAEDFSVCVQRAQETAETQSLEYMIPLDGEERWFEARVVGLHDDKVLTIVRDITQRHQAVEALRESESRFRNMADTAPALIWVSGPDRLCTYFNRQWLEFTGRTLEQEMGYGWAEGIHPEDYRRCMDTYTSSFDARQSFQMEYRLRRHDGEYRWIVDAGVPRFRPDGTFAGYIGSGMDITERKQVEHMLRRVAEGVSVSTSVGFWHSVARHLMEVLGADFVFVSRLAGDNRDRVRPIVSLIDGEIGENIEYDLKDTPCESVIELGVLSSASGIQARFPRDRQLVEMGVESYLGIALRESTGRAFGLVSVMSRLPLKNMANAEALLQIFASRVTTEFEREQAEGSLRQTQLELAHMARVMTTGELAATIAHEVNQPLTAMVANANAARRMLGSGNGNLDEAREAINDIVKDAHRASEIVGRIRTLLKKGEHRREPVVISEIIEEVVAIVRHDLVRRRVSVMMEMAQSLPAVEGDRVEIQQVLLNLVLNAIDAMSAVDDRSHSLLIRAAREDPGAVLVEVRDSGVGISSENLGRIFDPFYTTKREGIGMGLSICRTIIEAHGGKLWAVSNHDAGATVKFSLPAYVEEAP